MRAALRQTPLFADLGDAELDDLVHRPREKCPAEKLAQERGCDL